MYGSASCRFNKQTGLKSKSVLIAKRAALKNELYVALFGGLGNTLFQIAAGTALSKKHDYELFFIKPTNNPHKSCNYDCFYKDLIYKNPPNNAVKIKEKKTHQYDEIHLPKGPVILEGYWQCPKYFTGNEITWRRSSHTTPNTVGIHVRRGDYLKYSHIHPTMNMKYYKKALGELPVTDNIEYIIFSDDIEWCKKHFNFLDSPIFFTGNEVECLFKMTECEYLIIANSTFSWWGAYLSNAKKVIAPREWINGIKSDIYCSDWTVISGL